MRTLLLVTWLAVGATAVAWGLHGWRSAPVAGPEVPVAAQTAAPPADWRLLWARTAGSAETAVPVQAEDAARFQLIGVAGAAKAGSRAGVALLSIEGRPPRAHRVGDAVDERRIVLDITGNTVKLGVPGGPPSVTLQAPPLPPARGSAPTQ